MIKKAKPTYAKGYGEVKKVIVAISGGVDSSVVAFLLKEKGYEVIGVYMRLKPEDGEAESAARKVAEMLGIKFYPVNLMSKFKKEIINFFLDSYKNGLTPNPCVKCNKVIKFGELLRIREEMGADYLATGHYINLELRIKNEECIYKLYKGKDETKDQSYFLYHLTQEKLEHILFPLGEFKKSEVKKIAKKNNLPNLSKESQDICFLNDDHNIFLDKYITTKKGEIVDLTPTLPTGQASLSLKQGEGRKNVVGEHKGLPFYTIGQRKGVEIGGTGPYYVVSCDYKTNTLYVTKDRDDKMLYKKEVVIKNVNWISGEKIKNNFKCLAVIRYKHKGVECQVKEHGHSLLVRFKEAQRAVTPGQSVVFYSSAVATAKGGKKDELLGGGIIAS